MAQRINRRATPRNRMIKAGGKAGGRAGGSKYAGMSAEELRELLRQPDEQVEAILFLLLPDLNSKEDENDRT